MSKRKQKSQENDGDDSDVSLVDVDFEFFDPHPSVDYLAMKRLFIQLFQGDSESLNINGVVDLVLGQPLVGTTIKCDGKESDPYAFLTVLNMHVHQNDPSMKALTQYILEKSKSNPGAEAMLQVLLGPSGLRSENHVGLLLSERLINMPVQVVPPMYRMLTDEIQWANDDNEPYKFTHYILVSRIYRLTAEEAAELHAKAPQSKRHKGGLPTNTGGVFPFHPEDEVLEKFASHIFDYSFTSSQPREQDSFGLDTGGRVMIIPSEKLPQIVSTLNETFAPSS